MESLWLTLRAELRRRWRPMLGLAVLLGVIGGVVLTAAAGAERTDTAYPRLLQWARAAQVQLIPNSDTVPTRYFAALGRLPQVAAMSTTGLYQATLPGRGSQLTPVETMSSPDRALGITADRVKVLAGHRFDPRAAGQAMIDQKLAGLEHLRPGGQLHLLLIPNNPKTGNPEPQLAVQLTFRVSAVVTFDSQIVPQTGATGEPTALLSPPFTATATLSEPSPSTGCTGRVTCYNFFLLRYPAGTDPRAASARLLTTLTGKGCPPGSCLATTDQRPSDIRDYGGVRDTPLLLGIVLALLAVATMTHVLLTSARRRRRDLAMLKALGLVRRQVLGVVEWQAAALAATAFVLGVPLGIVAGRWAWVLFADAAGVSPGASIPVPLVLASIPVTIALAALIASGPGWTAARVRPAAALRAE